MKKFSQTTRNYPVTAADQLLPFQAHLLITHQVTEQPTCGKLTRALLSPCRQLTATQQLQCSDKQHAVHGVGVLVLKWGLVRRIAILRQQKAVTEIPVIK